MRKKLYDDDMLVDLLARRGFAYQQIANRLGISRKTVADIAIGRFRKELQPRITAARDALPPDERRPQRRKPTEAPPTEASTKPGPAWVEYDDDLLVDLITDWRVPTRRIAQEVGIGESMVTQIVAGKLRPDLQGRIDAELRNKLRATRRKAGGKDTSSPAPPLDRGGRGYDDDLLVELLGRGDLTFKEIARRVGLSRCTVQRIFTGKSRADLQPRIRQGVRDHACYVRTAARRALEAMVSKHIKVGMSADTELGRKCREFVIKAVWDGLDDSDDSSDTSAIPTPGLTAEDYEAIAILKGGPPHDDEDAAVQPVVARGDR